VQRGLVTHRATRTGPFPLGHDGCGGVETIEMVRVGAGVANKQIAAVFADGAELHVVVGVLVVVFVVVIAVFVDVEIVVLVFLGLFRLDAVLDLKKRSSVLEQAREDVHSKR